MTVHDIGARHGESVVSIATDLLGAARRGEVKMLAVCYVHEDGDVVSFVSAGDHTYKLCGAISQMLFDIHAAKNEAGS